MRTQRARSFEEGVRQGSVLGTFASSGTLNEPLVTTHAVVAADAPDEMQVPDPEKLPEALMLVSVEMVIEPAVIVQILLNAAPFPD